MKKKNTQKHVVRSPDWTYDVYTMESALYSFIHSLFRIIKLTRSLARFLDTLQLVKKKTVRVYFPWSILYFSESPKLYLLVKNAYENIEKTELRKADRTVGVNCNIFYPIFRQAWPDFFRVCLQLRKDVTI